MIVWSNGQVPELNHLDVQQQGEVDFSVKVKSDWDSSGASASSTTITDEVNISQFTQKFSIKVNSESSSKILS